MMMISSCCSCHARLCFEILFHLQRDCRDIGVAASESDLTHGLYAALVREMMIIGRFCSPFPLPLSTRRAGRTRTLPALMLHLIGVIWAERALPAVDLTAFRRHLRRDVP